MGLTDAMGSVLSGGLSAAGSLASGIMSAIQGKKDRKAYENQQHLNRVFENEQASKAYQRQVEFWKMQNEYNSPAEQMARLRAAGLNPDLAISGNVQNSAGGLSSVSKGNAPSASYAPPTDFSAFENAAQKAAQTVKTVAESKLTQVETSLQEKKVIAQEIDNQWNPRLYRNEFMIGKRKYVVLGVNAAQGRQQIKESQQRVTNMVQECQNLEQVEEQLKLQVGILGERLAIEKLHSAFESITFPDKVLGVKLENILKKENIKLTREEWRDLVATRAARIAGIEAQTYKDKMQGNLSRSQIWLNKTIANGERIENRLKEQGVQLNDYTLSALPDVELYKSAQTSKLLGTFLTFGLSDSFSAILKALK